MALSMYNEEELTSFLESIGIDSIPFFGMDGPEFSELSPDALQKKYGLSDVQVINLKEYILLLDYSLQESIDSPSSSSSIHWFKEEEEEERFESPRILGSDEEEFNEDFHDAPSFFEMGSSEEGGEGSEESEESEEEGSENGKEGFEEKEWEEKGEEKMNEEEIRILMRLFQEQDFGFVETQVPTRLKESDPQECPICSEIKPLLPFSPSCPHLFCSTCINNYFQSLISSKRASNEVKCMGHGCRETIDHARVKRLATEEVFEEFDNMLTLLALSGLPDFRWCLNENKCNFGQEHIGGQDNPIVICTKCKSKSCYFHRIPFHTGLTCEAYDKLKEEEEALNDSYFKENTKICPKCQKRIVKGDDNCDKLTCACNHVFCWLCLVDYSLILREGNHVHLQTCQHYRAIEPPGM